MIWLAITHFASLAIFLWLAERAPELPWHD